jgi:hypothetical protein
MLIYIPVSLALTDMVFASGSYGEKFRLSPDNEVFLNFLKVHAVIIVAVIFYSLARVYRDLIDDRVLSRSATAVIAVVWMLLVLPGFSNLFGQFLLDSEISVVFRALLASLSLLPVLTVMLTPWIVSRIRHQ